MRLLFYESGWPKLYFWPGAHQRREVSLVGLGNRGKPLVTHLLYHRWTTDTSRRQAVTSRIPGTSAPVIPLIALFFPPKLHIIHTDMAWRGFPCGSLRPRIHLTANFHFGWRHTEKDAFRHSTLPSYRCDISQYGLIPWLIEGGFLLIGVWQCECRLQQPAVLTEQQWNARPKQTRVSRKDPPDSGNIRHVSHMRKSWGYAAGKFTFIKCGIVNSPLQSSSLPVALFTAPMLAVADFPLAGHFSRRGHLLSLVADTPATSFVQQTPARRPDAPFIAAGLDLEGSPHPECLIDTRYPRPGEPRALLGITGTLSKHSFVKKPPRLRLQLIARAHQRRLSPSHLFLLLFLRVKHSAEDTECVGRKEVGGGGDHGVASERLLREGATVAEREASRLTIFACENRAGLSAACLWDVPFPPHLNSGAAQYSPQSPSSALNTSLLRAAQISPLTLVRRVLAALQIRAKRNDMKSVSLLLQLIERINATQLTIDRYTQGCSHGPSYTMATQSLTAAMHAYTHEFLSSLTYWVKL
ncbi:hypothetical protein PR048_025335 [Dryococelus australis]|uniref:Uncharacterized protein n=1 Tax=Dryococelus australis TaxID=614101 RepID=A0ABQ9GR28_9NEOP|nr:hypothetical protein PR048_025335 [Dryococelus australis]